MATPCYTMAAAWDSLVEGPPLLETAQTFLGQLMREGVARVALDGQGAGLDAAAAA